MSDHDSLKSRFPTLASRLECESLATLPTPLRDVIVDFESRPRNLLVKYDNLTGDIYGGNKLRKLEYIFPYARSKNCGRVATFGAAGSNHAIATALYAREAGFDCTCFLSHQSKTPMVAATLNRHIECGTELVRYGGAYRTRIATLRDRLWDRHAWVIPMGGSSWLGNVGFVSAGLELAEQLEEGGFDVPDRIYVGAGTMGTAIGIGLGFAAVGVDSEVHAVRVSDTSIMNREKLDRLLYKSAAMMRRLDPDVPDDLADRTNIVIRDEFFAPGYAKGTEATDEAIAFGRDALDLKLEITYTGKAMSALLADWRDEGSGEFSALYWHTYNSVPFDVPTDAPLDTAALPEEFLRYFG